MGIASQDIDGDGRPEVFLTNQADNKLKTLVAGATGPDYTDISRKRATTATHPYTGGDTGNRPPGMPSSGTSTTTASWTSSSPRATSRHGGVAAKDPPNLLIGQPDLTFVEGGQAAGIVDFARGRGAAVVDFNLDGLLDIVEVTRRENVRLWRRVGAGTDDRRRRWVTGRRSASSSRRRTATRSAPGSRQDGGSGHGPRAHRRRRTRGRTAWLDALRTRGIGGAEVRSSGRTARSGRGCP